MRAPVSTSYQGAVPGKYTSSAVAPACTTGLTRRASPTSHWSSMASTADSSGYSIQSGRMTGSPVAAAAAKSVYHSGR